MTKPLIRERAADMICPECGQPVERRSKHGPKPVFCRPEHRKAFSNRMIVDGAGVLPYLLAWRIDRGSGEIAQASLQKVCQILDGLNEAAGKAGRPRADLYAAKLLAAGQPTVIEARYGRRKIAEARARKADESAKGNEDGNGHNATA